LAGAVPFALTLLVAFIFDLVGWLPGSVAEALAPATRPTFGEAIAPLLVLGFLFALAWAFVRPVLAGRPDRLGVLGPGPAVALALIFSIEVLLVCVADPFTALVLVPGVHLCVIGALPERPRRSFLAGALALTALTLPVLALVYYGGRLDLGGDPLAYALLLVGSATGSVWTALLTSLVAGTLFSATLMSLARARVEEPQERVTVRGPATYAGPGSLGGTESALRR
jgi:hypothetical protein